jgi:hypothetical protein
MPITVQLVTITTDVSADDFVVLYFLFDISFLLKQMLQKIKKKKKILRVLQLSLFYSMIKIRQNISLSLSPPPPLQQNTWLNKNSLMTFQLYNCMFRILHTHEANSFYDKTHKPEGNDVWHEHTPTRKAVPESPDFPEHGI